MFVRERRRGLLHRAGDVHRAGRQPARRLPRLRRARARARRKPGPRPPGSAGASSPSTRSSPSCASGWASSSSGPSADVMRLPGRQGRGQAAGRGRRRAGRALERRARRPRSRRPPPRARRSAIPLMVKATAGGGGRGIRRVDEPGELPRPSSARAPRRGGVRRRDRPAGEARDARRGTSRCRRSPTAQGNAWAVGVRDCSLQRRHQKVIEESASTALTPEQDRELREAARAARARGRLPRRRHGGVPVRAASRRSRSWRSTRASRWSIR